MPELLTGSLIKSLRPKKTRYVISDTLHSGLGVMVFPSGTKSFIYRYKPSKCKYLKHITLGCATKLSVTDARKAVKIKAGDIAKGIDPLKEEKEAVKNEKKVKLDTDLRLFNYIDKYYEPYALENNQTAKEILQVLRKEFVFIKDKRIDKIDNLDIDKWRSNREKDKITFTRVKCIYAYLKACINTALKHYKLLDRFELQHYSLKRKNNEKINPPKLRYLSKDEAENLLIALSDRDNELRNKRQHYIDWHLTRNSKKEIPPAFNDNDYPDYITPIVIIGFHTGLDLGDIFDLTWEDHIDFDNNQIHKIRNKTSHRSNNPQPVNVPLSPILKKVLQRWGEQHGTKGLLFKNPRTKKRLTNIKTAWKSLLDRAEIKNFRFKDLRHTFGSWLAISGNNILNIRDLLGHADVKTTQIYAHLCPDEKRTAVVSTFS